MSLLDLFQSIFDYMIPIKKTSKFFSILSTVNLELPLKFNYFSGNLFRFNKITTGLKSRLVFKIICQNNLDKHHEHNDEENLNMEEFPLLQVSQILIKSVLLQYHLKKIFYQ